MFSSRSRAVSAAPQLSAAESKGQPPSSSSESTNAVTPPPQPRAVAQPTQSVAGRINTSVRNADATSAAATGDSLATINYATFTGATIPMPTVNSNTVKNTHLLAIVDALKLESRELREEIDVKNQTVVTLANSLYESQKALLSATHAVKQYEEQREMFASELVTMKSAVNVTGGLKDKIKKLEGDLAVAEQLYATPLKNEIDLLKQQRDADDAKLIDWKNKVKDALKEGKKREAAMAEDREKLKQQLQAAELKITELGFEIERVSVNSRRVRQCVDDSTMTDEIMDEQWLLSQPRLTSPSHTNAAQQMLMLTGAASLGGGAGAGTTDPLNSPNQMGVSNAPMLMNHQQLQQQFRAMLPAAMDALAPTFDYEPPSSAGAGSGGGGDFSPQLASYAIASFRLAQQNAPLGTNWLMGSSTNNSTSAAASFNLQGDPSSSSSASNTFATIANSLLLLHQQQNTNLNSLLAAMGGSGAGGGGGGPDPSFTNISFAFNGSIAMPSATLPVTGGGGLVDSPAASFAAPSAAVVGGLGGLNPVNNRSVVMGGGGAGTGNGSTTAQASLRARAASVLLPLPQSALMQHTGGGGGGGGYNLSAFPSPTSVRPLSSGFGSGGNGVASLQPNAVSGGVGGGNNNNMLPDPASLLAIAEAAQIPRYCYYKPDGIERSIFLGLSPLQQRVVGLARRHFYRLLDADRRKQLGITDDGGDSLQNGEDKGGSAFPLPAPSAAAKMLSVPSKSAVLPNSETIGKLAEAMASTARPATDAAVPFIVTVRFSGTSSAPNSGDGGCGSGGADEESSSGSSAAASSAWSLDAKMLVKPGMTAFDLIVTCCNKFSMRYDSSLEPTEMQLAIHHDPSKRRITLAPHREVHSYSYVAKKAQGGESVVFSLVHANTMADSAMAYMDTQL